jgi:hypothetical protein
LSKLVNLTVNYDNKGSANISIGGVFAADGAAATEFEVVNDDGKLTIAALNTS